MFITLLMESLQLLWNLWRLGRLHWLVMSLPVRTVLHRVRHLAQGHNLPLRPARWYWRLLMLQSWRLLVKRRHCLLQNVRLLPRSRKSLHRLLNLLWRHQLGIVRLHHLRWRRPRRLDIRMVWHERVRTYATVD